MKGTFSLFSARFRRGGERGEKGEEKPIKGGK